MRIARRRFISLLGGAVMAAPRAAATQELPVVGFLHAATVESYVSSAPGFAQGLKQEGFAEAQNVAIEYRFANGRLDQLAALAADLASRPLALIIAGGAVAALAAKAAAPTVPIVIVSGSDPASLGLAASLDKPGGNVTGVIFAAAGLMSKRLGIVRELVPRATTIGYLVEDGRAYASDPAVLRAIGEIKNELFAAAAASGWQVVVAEIGSDRDYEAAFAKLVEGRADALIVAPSAVFASDVDDIVALTLRHEIPTIFPRRADVVAAGLISYGAGRIDAWRQGGIYVGQILKGAKPANMPVLQSTRLELIINLPIAKSLDLTISPNLRAQANEVME
jgi:putative tryptophan/tyrosine transport system substrate-binding protein